MSLTLIDNIYKRWKDIKEYVDTRIQFSSIIDKEVTDGDLSALNSKISKKQDKLKAGKNITIQNNVISSTSEGKTYVPGQNIGIDNTTIYAKGYVWDENNQSFAEGGYTTASGEHSHAEGDGTNASGYASHVEGQNTRAEGSNSHAEGVNTQATANHAHAEGYYTNASGEHSHAEGAYTYATASGSHAEGNSTTAANINSHAEGQNTTASGESSHAEGYRSQATSSNYSSNTLTADSSTENGRICHAEGNATIAQGYNSHAEGKKTFAKGGISHAEGNSTTASGEYSHAEGQSTTASSEGSHAEGAGTTASGEFSHAEGNGAAASGEGSHAEGIATQATNGSEHAEGQHNFSHKASDSYGDAGNTQHSVGIGTSDSNRKNAFEIMQNGDVYINGLGTYDGTNPSSADSLQDVINNIIATEKVSISIVSSLPSVGDSNTIYFVPSSGTNNYDEYIYENGTWIQTRTVTIDLTNYYTKTQTDTLLTSKQDSTAIVDLTAGSSVTQALDPNKLYMFGEKTDITIALNTGSSSVVNEYMFQFDSGSTATTLNVPNTITWMKDPDIQANKTYQVSIVNDLAIIGEW